MPYGRRYGRRATSRGASKALINKAYAKGFFAAQPKGPDTFIRGAFGADYKSATSAQRLLRRAVPYKGAGAYWGKALGGWAGGRLAAATGINQFGKWGAQAGDWASDQLQKKAKSMYSGQGEYVNNSLIVGGAQSMDVVGNVDETETITIRHCESIMDLYAPTIALNQTSSFESMTIDVNPGLTSFSKKLSSIAKNYVQYEIKQLVFEVRPHVSESAINNGLTGSILGAVLYDPTAEPPDNKDEFLDLSGAVSGRITDRLNIGVECDAQKTKDTEYFVRTGPVPLGRDVDEYDHCKLCIAMNNIPHDFSNQAIAELYVFYTVELRMWKPNRDILREVIMSSRDIPTSVAWVPGQQFSDNNVAYAQLNNIGCKYTSPTQGIWDVEFPPSFSGGVELTLTMEGDVHCSDCVVSGLTGNIDRINDMFAAGTVDGATSAESVDSPGHLAFAGHPINVAGTNVGQRRIILRARMRIRSATGGVKNVIRINSGLASVGTVNQWVLEITEYSNQMFQKGYSNVVPKFVDKLGVQVSP